MDALEMRVLILTIGRTITKSKLKDFTSITLQKSYFFLTFSLQLATAKCKTKVHKYVCNIDLLRAVPNAVKQKGQKRDISSCHVWM